MIGLPRRRLRRHVFSARRADQQNKRDRASSAWRSLFIGFGVSLTLFCFVIPQYGRAFFFAYWTGGLMIFLAISRLYLEPTLDDRYPLSSPRQRQRRPRKQPSTDEPVAPLINGS